MKKRAGSSESTNETRQSDRLKDASRSGASKCPGAIGLVERISQNRRRRSKGAPDHQSRPAVGGLFGGGGRARPFFLGLELRVVFVFAKEIRQSLGLANLADRRVGLHPGLRDTQRLGQPARAVESRSASLAMSTFFRCSMSRAECSPFASRTASIMRTFGTRPESSRR